MSKDQQREIKRNLKKHGETWPRPVLPPYNFSFDNNPHQIPMDFGGGREQQLSRERRDAKR
jgi:hypothetical protein